MLAKMVMNVIKGAARRWAHGTSIPWPSRTKRLLKVGFHSFPA